MFFFRVEGGSRIGMGHLVRCMSIASAVKKYTDVTFFCAFEDSESVIRENGFEVIKLTSSGFELKEVSEICEHTAGETKPYILVDSYEASKEYLSELKKYFKVIYMDDLAEEVFPADVIINYNAYATIEEYEDLYMHCQDDEKPTFLVGSEYIPLREQFISKVTVKKDEVSDILIMVGGSDSLNLSEGITREIIEFSDEYKTRRIHIVCGKMNPNLSKLQELEREYANVRIHINVSDMCSLMKECDVAISAAGSTCYELCAAGLPFVVFSYVDNQKRILSWAERGIAVSAGDIREKRNIEDSYKDIIQGLVKLCGNTELRKNMALNNKKLIDGNGALRLAKKLKDLKEE